MRLRTPSSPTACSCWTVAFVKTPEAQKLRSRPVIDSMKTVIAGLDGRRKAQLGKRCAAKTNRG